VGDRDDGDSGWWLGRQPKLELLDQELEFRLGLGVGVSEPITKRGKIGARSMHPAHLHMQIIHFVMLHCSIFRSRQTYELAAHRTGTLSTIGERKTNHVEIFTRGRDDPEPKRWDGDGKTRAGQAEDADRFEPDRHSWF
jgi:hypothetical protein